ncbi:hypothetical protein D3C75_975620 [compost metagenome]
MPAEGVHQAQHTTLLTVVRHFQQGLGLQLVNRLAECMLLRLQGFAQGYTAGDAALQFAEVVAQALQQCHFFCQQLP